MNVHDTARLVEVVMVLAENRSGRLLEARVGLCQSCTKTTKLDTKRIDNKRLTLRGCKLLLHYHEEILDISRVIHEFAVSLGEICVRHLGLKGAFLQWAQLHLLL
jgi:hypothetical protein